MRDVFKKAGAWVFIAVLIAFVMFALFGSSQTSPSLVQPIMAHYETQALCERDFGEAQFCSPDNCSSIELVEGGNRVCSPRFYWSYKQDLFMMIKEGFSRAPVKYMSREGPLYASYLSEEGSSILDD